MCVIDLTGARGTDLLSSQKSVCSSTVGPLYMWFPGIWPTSGCLALSIYFWKNYALYVNHTVQTHVI